MLKKLSIIFLVIGFLISGCSNKKILHKTVLITEISFNGCQECELDGVDLSLAILSKTNLYKANLARANLTQSTLNNTELTGANLTNANLNRADLTDADLWGANLSNSDLTGANLSNVNLTGADLSGASWKNVILTGAIFCNTTLPDLKIDNSSCPEEQDNKKLETAKTLPPETPQVKSQPPKSKVNAIATGTGFIFGSQDYIITNYHVVKGTSSLKVKFLNEETIEAKIVAKDTKNDVAILKLNKTPSVQTSEIKFGDSAGVRMGDKVFTIGYPSVGIMGQRPKYTEGVISSVTGVQDDPTVFQTTVQIQPGNSGGPLFNEKGEVVGLTTASLSNNAIDSLGAVPQNVNYAIKSSFVKNTVATVPESLLSNRGIVVTPKSANSRADFLERISKNVVLILGVVK